MEYAEKRQKKGWNSLSQSQSEVASIDPTEEIRFHDRQWRSKERVLSRETDFRITLGMNPLSGSVAPGL